MDSQICSWPRRVFIITAGVMAAFGGTVARADGGTSITSAPLVTYGTQEFGNTSDAILPYSCATQIADFWALPVLAGDRVTIQFGSSPGSGAYALDVLPEGTTDYDVGQADVQTTYVGANGDGQAVLPIVAHTGSIPLIFNAGCGGEDTPGPYTFTAYDAHEAVLSLSKTSVGAHSTVFSLAIHNPTGDVITDSALTATYSLRTGGKRVILKSLHAPYTYIRRWPKDERRDRMTVQVRVTGPTYRPASIRISVVAR